MLVTVICAVLTVWDLHRKTIRQTNEAMATLSLVLAEQTTRYVQVVDLLLQEIQLRVRHLDIETPDLIHVKRHILANSGSESRILDAHIVDSAGRQTD